MLIPVFRTWVAGEVVTAAYMNSNIRDAGNFFLARPLAVLRQTVGQSVATSGSGAPLLFDAEDIDSDNGHSTVTNTSRYTAQTTGWYLPSGGVGWTASATGRRGCWWLLTGTGVNGTESMLQTTAANSVCVPSRARPVFMTALTDYLELNGYQDTGGALTTSVVTIEQSHMTVFYIHT